MEYKRKKEVKNGCSNMIVYVLFLIWTTEKVKLTFADMEKNMKEENFGI
jgi:hypothetical protein